MICQTNDVNCLKIMGYVEKNEKIGIVVGKMMVNR
jgi:hypothetical protein